MRPDQVIFLQAALGLEGGLSEALTLLTFAHAFAGESKVAPKNVKSLRNETKALAAGKAILELVRAENPNEKGKGRPINLKSTRQRVFSAITTILRKDGEKEIHQLFDQIARFHPDIPMDKIKANASAMQGLVRRYGVWSLPKAA